MQKTSISILLAFWGILFLASCAKEGPTGPTGPAGPGYTGSIGGYIRLYDKYGSPVFTGFTGIQLTLASTTVILTANTITAPGTTGAYEYTSVLTGNYSITATGDSLYAATVLNDLSFVAGVLNQDIKLSAYPDSFLTSFYSAKGSAGLYDSLVVQVNADTRMRNCIVFVNTTTAVGNLPANYLLKYVAPIPANATIASLIIPQQDLTNAGIASGTMLYFAAFSYVVDDASAYEDLATGKKVYDAVNIHPLVDSAMAP